jgi:glutamine synthetase
MLAAGLDGIKNNLTPPPAVNKNIFAMTCDQMDELGISSLPGSLYDALQEFKADPLVKKTLGDHIFNVYYEFKTREWDSYRTAVHPWEIDQYLTRY